MDEKKYERAKKRMEDIKGFYSHLLVYLVVNAVLIILQLGIINGRYLQFGEGIWSYLSTPIIWGVGLLFHGLYVFQGQFKFFKSWEERKIQEYMDKDDEEFKKTSRWE